MRLRALAAGLLAALAHVPAHSGTGPVVLVDGGLIEGERLPGGRLAFRGVPFAAPPIGALRWRPPQPVRRWSGVRPAVRSAPACAQLSDGWNKANADYSSEDCLYLEVATPAEKPAAPMPVIVWIHGGSNKAGGGAGTIASSILAHGIVLVSIQYRLGALGFLAHPALTAESRWHASGNWGLMDQQAALRWVRRNIAHFGGDPDNVTIAGESAGAEDVSLLTISPLARGLYAKAIEESGTASFGFPPRDLATSERYGEEIAQAAGAGAQTAAALRALPVSAILHAERAVHYPGLVENGTVWLQTTVDGHVVPDDPARLFAAGRINPGPLLVGWNAREIDFFHDPQAARAALQQTWGAAAEPKLRSYGLDRADPAADPRLGPAPLRVATDLVFRCPTRFVALSRARVARPTWLYQFDYAAPGRQVSHASELPFVFGRPGDGTIPADAPPMQAYWARFARTGDPNGPGLPFWPRFDLQTGPAMLFGQAGSAAADGLTAICGGFDRP